MKNAVFLLAAVLAVLSVPAAAEAPHVATDIPPVHSLVARVMDGVGGPDLIIRPGASPHSYALRPSEAAMLAQADLVFWVGPDMTPWLERSIRTLAGNAVSVVLQAEPGLALLEYRDGVSFGDHVHEQASANPDPHIWLDPDNAAVWLDVIANELADVDPDNAAIYIANAVAGKAELARMKAEIDVILASARGKPFVVFHDAYHYFESRFDIEAAAAVSLGDAATPGAARVAGIRREIKDIKAVCIFGEPNFSPKLLTSLTDSTDLKIGELDPLGAGLELGKDLYQSLIRGLAISLADCLS